VTQLTFLIYVLSVCVCVCVCVCVFVCAPWNTGWIGTGNPRRLDTMRPPLTSLRLRITSACVTPARIFLLSDVGEVWVVGEPLEEATPPHPSHATAASASASPSAAATSPAAMFATASTFFTPAALSAAAVVLAARRYGRTLLV
jgi:hypothetical protein